MDHMVHWTIWYIGPLGALEHLVQRWNTWCIGPFGTVDHLVHLTKWSTWAYGPLDHLDQCTNWSIVPNGPCKKNISPHSFILLFSLLPPLISLLSLFHTFFYFSCLECMQWLVYIMYFILTPTSFTEIRTGDVVVKVWYSTNELRGQSHQTWFKCSIYVYILL